MLLIDGMGSAVFAKLIRPAFVFPFGWPDPWCRRGNVFYSAGDWPVTDGWIAAVIAEPAELSRLPK